MIDIKNFRAVEFSGDFSLSVDGITICGNFLTNEEKQIINFNADAVRDGKNIGSINAWRRGDEGMMFNINNTAADDFSKLSSASVDVLASIEAQIKKA